MAIHKWSVLFMQKHCPCHTNCSCQNAFWFSSCTPNPSYYFHWIFIFYVVKHKIICCCLFLITYILCKLRISYLPQQLSSYHHNIRAKLKFWTIFCSILDWLDCVMSLWKAWSCMNVGNLKCTGMCLSWVSTEELSSVVQVALGSHILPIN